MLTVSTVFRDFVVRDFVNSGIFYSFLPYNPLVTFRRSNTKISRNLSQGHPIRLSENTWENFHLHTDPYST
jgi:hypothetical protein